MTSIVAPRYELPIVDASGRMSREWYKFLVQLSKAVDSSPTSSDDIQYLENTDSSLVESLALKALKSAQDSPFLLMTPDDRTPTPDVSLLAWWPGDTK